jgi:HEAT repeat protein
MTRIGILTTDTDLIVKSWDSALEQMTGITADRARGRRLDEIVPELQSRALASLIREPLVSGSAQVLAPALHKYLIPCPPLAPSQEFEHMQQRVVVGALRDDHQAVGLVISIEDVTDRLERERELSRQLRDAAPAVRLDAIEQLAPLQAIDGLGPLTSVMGDDDWRVRRAGVRALAARRDAGLVEAVVSALRDGHRNFSVLSSALQLLTLTGVDFTDALVHLMHDPDPDLRIQAALALGTQRRPEAVAALLHALDDSDPNIRFQAIESLGKQAAPAALDRLLGIAESGDFFLAFAAVDALVQINDPLAAARLVPLLADPSIAAAVAEALGRLGDEDAVEPLIDALVQGSAPVDAVVGALVNIHDRYEVGFGGGQEISDIVRRRLDRAGVRNILEQLRKATGPSLRALVVVVGWLRDPAIPAALARLLGSVDARHDVIEALVRFGSPAVDQLIDQLRVDDLDAVRSAVVALGRIGDRRAVPALLDLLDDEHRELWVAAAGALSRLGDPLAFESLLPLIGDSDAAVRQAAVGALNSIGHPAMSGRVCSMIADPNPHVRESAIRIAGYFGYPECLDMVLQACRDDDELVRAAAIEQLPYFEDDRIVAALDAALTRETPRARAAAASALGAMSSRETQALLHRAVLDTEPWVRYFGAISLGRHADASAADILAPLAESDPALQVRVAAIEALGAVGGTRALAILHPVLVGDQEDAGHAAARAIGRIQNISVVPALQGALRSVDPARRLAAVEGLAAYGGPDSIEPLQWTASSDSDTRVVRAAFDALTTIANNSSPASEGAVRSLVASLSDPGLREQALGALARLAPPAIPWVAESLAADDPRVRRAGVDALGRLSHASASAWLIKALCDADEIVRAEAVKALSRLGTRGLANRFSAMAANDASWSVRQAATAAMARNNAGVRREH